jgi:uncharacterized phage protein gp47/JayE
MPWATPTLRKVRENVRDNITSSLYGAAYVGNNVLRVMGDTMSATCHLVLRYIDWLALQLLPLTAEVEWLDKHADIWLVNADGTVGRKAATYAEGICTFTGSFGGIIIPAGTQLVSRQTIGYETLEDVLTSSAQQATPGRVRALDPGADSNLEQGDELAMQPALTNVDTLAVVDSMTGGTDEENDEDLRIRVLQRIRQPPMGGAAHDYIRWALAVPGVTRAWVTPLEMGIGTVTVRVLFDDLRADDDGWPRDNDLQSVTDYIDTVRPVAVKDFFVVAPIKQFIDVHIRALDPDNPETRASIEASLDDMLFNYAAPGQTIFSVWKAQAIMNTPGVLSFDLLNWADDVMETPGHMAVLGDIVYG